MKERRFDIDNFKGILIFLVVFGHFLMPNSLRDNGLCYEIFSFIYFFHMPAFLFLAGLTTKKENFKKDISKYIFLYFLFNFSMSIIDYFLNGIEISFIKPYYSMWFLLSIIAYRTLVFYCNNKLLLIFSIIISFLSGFSNLDNTFALSRIIAFLPFFLVGYFFKEFFINEKDNKYKRTFLMYFLSFIFTLIFIIFFSYITDFSLNFYTMEEFQTYFQFVCRIILIIVNFIFIISLFMIISNKKIFFLSKIGKYSLNIYLIHRFITFVFEKIFIEDTFRIIFAFIGSIIVCFIFGSDFFNKKFNKFIDKCFNKQIYFYFFFILYLITFKLSFSQNTYVEKVNKIDNLDNCIKISYVGDFLLFEDELIKAKKDSSYDFSDYFKYTKDYLGDYTFGVLEGPVSDFYYSTGNYNDRKKVSLNYPKEFLEEISKNIDFVTIGTNHLLDRGKDGLIQTIDNLNKYNLDFTGGYLSEKNKEQIKIIDIEGIKVAVLSYVYGINEMDELESYMYNSFDEKEIKKDIFKAKEKGAQKIIAMTHIGTQFSHDVDANQYYYNNFLAKNGVDIIFSDHAHATEPIEFINDTVIFNCPGNYTTSYAEYDGDYSAICNIYLDKESLEVVTTSIVPLISNKRIDDITIPIPCYLLNDITSSNIVTKSMINKEFDFVQKEIFYNKYGYAILESEKTIDEDSVIFDYIGDDSICFIGDSITEGSNNGYIGWFEALNTDNEIFNISKGGATSETILEILKGNNKTKDFDCYVIAIGTNDIRYNNLSTDEYLSNLNEIINYIGLDKKYIFLDPWYFLDSDLISIIDINEKSSTLDKYSNALEEFCNKNNYLHVSQNDYLEDFFNNNLSGLYLNDYIHPTNIGVEVYSKSFIKGKTNIERID